jgi:hypothetical protein
MLRTIDEAAAYIAAQPPLDDALAIHWLDQGSTRLAERASIRRLQAVWEDGRHGVDGVSGRGAGGAAGSDDDPVEVEATRLFRLVIAMAIVAKGRPSG